MQNKYVMFFLITNFLSLDQSHVQFMGLMLWWMPIKWNHNCWNLAIRQILRELAIIIIIFTMIFLSAYLWIK